MRAIVVSILALAMLSVGCGTKQPCRPGSTLLSFTLPAALVLPTTMTITVSVDGNDSSSTVTTSHRDGSIEIDFPNGYPKDQPVMFTVAVPSMPGLSLSTTKTLSAACETVTLDLSGVSDGGVDWRIGMTPTVQSFGSIVEGGNSAAATFTVANLGGTMTGVLPAALLSGAAASAYAITADTCMGKTLAATSTCEITVRFSPTATGDMPATLSIDNGAHGLARALLGGTGIAQGALTIAPATFDFGSVSVGNSSAAQVFTVTNTGDVATTALSAMTTDPTFTITGNTCMAALSPSATCTVTVAFVPTDAGAKLVSLTISADTGGVAAASLTGTGQGLAQLSIVPATFDFSSVVVGNQSALVDFTVTNIGVTAAGPVTTVSSDATQFTIIANTCPDSSAGGLASGASCTISMKFVPTAIGDQAASLMVWASPGGTASSTLKGKGLMPGALSLSSSAQDFGPLAILSSSSEFVFTVTNTGDTMTGAIVTSIDDTDDYRISSNTCASALAPSGTCTIGLTYTPQSVGASLATLSVSSSPGGMTTASVTGTGTATITVTTTGSGVGQIGSSPSGINCGATCTATFSKSPVTLTASTTDLFNGWSGASCTGTGTCVITLDAPTKAVSAAFTATETLNISVQGSGSGSTISDPPGIDCPTKCTANFPIGTAVTLNAMPSTHSDFFTGFMGGGGCDGIAPCVVTMDKSYYVGVTFEAGNLLNVIKAGTGGGRITSGLGEIDCGDTCDALIATTDSVTLTATADPTSTFGGFAGITGCGAATTCTTTMAAAHTATATFTAIAGTKLAVDKIGTGTVTSLPAGINCGATCSASFTAGTMVTLQARTTVASGYFFAGWSGGGCAGPFRDCVTTVSGAKTVTAVFKPIDHNLVFVSSKALDRNLGSASAYDAQCQSLATAAGLAGTYMAWVSDATGPVPRLSVPGTSGATPSRGFMRMDGHYVADSVQSMLAPRYQTFNAVLFDETGLDVTTGDFLGDVDMYTATNPNDGSPSVGDNCKSSTSNSSADDSRVGNASGGPFNWDYQEFSSCSVPLPVYCFMRDKNIATAPVRNLGKVMYLTKSAFIPGGGITAADASCNAEKPAGIGTVKAFIATTTTTAASLAIPTQRYVRPDGEMIGFGSQLATMRLFSGIWQAGDGSYSTDPNRIWVGSPAPDQVGSAANTCMDWTSTTPANGVFTGVGYMAGRWWGNSYAQSCSGTGGNAARLYCIEQ